MTITYTAHVATCRGIGCFLKLLFRWRGSIYKLVWMDLVCFLMLFYFLQLIYRVALSPEQQILFETISKYCSEYSDQIPLSFVLGFYVSIVMTRWWNQYESIPWPDPVAMLVSAYINGQDERGRQMRRTIMRYVCLCLTMVLTNMSPRVKRRFPTNQHLVDAGLMMENEKTVLEQFNRRFESYSKHWMPIAWASSIVTRARREGRIPDDFAVKSIIDELNKFRGQAGVLINYDTISVPLVYTQVVTLAVYTYFMTSLMAQQYLIENRGDYKSRVLNQYFPFFTTLQFFFYMGWLKVAESLINPFGEDDDDFEMNWIIDRNLQVCYMIVDEMHHDHPTLVRDQYWDEMPTELPYTLDTQSCRESHPRASTANIPIRKSSLTSSKLDEMSTDDSSNGIQFTKGLQYRRRSSPNSFVSSIKRMIGRDDHNSSMKRSTIVGPLPTFEQTPSPDVARPSPSSFTNSNVSNRKLSEQIIEEVDEHVTITSMRAQKIRPLASSLFAAVSQPVDVPAPRHNQRRHNQRRTSRSFDHKLAIGDESNPIGYLCTSAPASTYSHHVESATRGDADDQLVDAFDQSVRLPNKQFVARSVSGQQQYQSDKTAERGTDRANRSVRIADHMQIDTPTSMQNDNLDVYIYCEDND